MAEYDKIRLTSTEMTSLWSDYMNDSMSICVLKHFLNNIDDDDVKPILEYAMEISQEHVKTVTDIFNKENFPLPQGFTEQDVKLDAPCRPEVAKSL